MTIDDRELDALVRATAPRPDPGPELDDVLGRMASGISGSRRTRRLVVAPLAVAVVLASAAAGYAVWHDSNSADFAEVVTGHVSRLTLPPGTDRAAYVAQFAEQGRRSPVSISDLAVSSSAAHYGVCAWLTAWDRRHAAGDTAGAAQAVTALNLAVEAGPLRATDGGGVVGHLRDVAAAAGREDLTPSQVAAVLGVPPATVRKRLERARARLRAAMAAIAAEGASPLSGRPRRPGRTYAAG